MNKSEAIKLFESLGWTKADAIRALEVVDFKANPDEITIFRAVTHFAGSELNQRQRLQAAQKGMVTKKNKEIEAKDTENKVLRTKVGALASKNNELVGVNEQLKKDNKALKNLVDAIKLRLAIDTKKLLQYEDSEIRKAAIKLFNSTLG